MARLPEIIRRNPVSQTAVGVPDAGAGWRALADIAAIGEDFVKPAAVEQTKLEGEKSVYRDATGALKVDARSALGGEMAAIHNSAAFSKYLSQKQIEVSETMTELAVKFEFDPAGFQEAADSYVKLQEADENIPPQLKSQMLDGIRTEASRRFNGLYKSEVDRSYRESDKSTSAARDMLADDYVSLYMGGDMEAAEAKLKEIEGLTEFRSKAGYISETPAESEAFLRGVRGSAKAAALARELDELEGAESISDEKRAEIEAVLKDDDISPGVRSKLYNATQGRLKGIDAAGFVNGISKGSYESKLVGAESSYNDKAKAETSTAYGPHQFLKGTWMEMVKRYKPEWAKGKSETELLGMRADREKSSEMFQHFRKENQDVLRANGLPVTEGTEYLAHFLGAAGAVDVLSADPNAPVSDVVSAAAIKANPFLANMDVSDLRNWANRKMSVKASDLAMQQTKIDQIEDSEVRGMASKILNEKVGAKKRMEDAAAVEYEDRLAMADSTLTEQQIFEDHNLSDGDQRSLVKRLRTQREDQYSVQQTVARLNDPGASWDMYDTKDRNAVDDAYSAALDGADPLDDKAGQASALQIAQRTGFVPKTMFNALRAAVSSGDPARMALAMEFTGRVLADQPGAIKAYGGRSEVEKALSDYKHFAEFNSPEVAAQKVADLRDPENVAKRKNMSDAAKEATKKLKPEDITAEFDDWWFSDPNLGGTVEETEMMSEYRRNFEEAFLDTGDAALSKSRALDEMGRIYGPNMVSGSKRVMKFPPQNFYPAVDGSHDWMQGQLEADVSAFVAPDGGKAVDASDIKLVSDPQTRAEIMSGKPPSYTVFYMNDGVLDILPQRFRFDPSGAQSQAAEDFQRGRDNAIKFEGEFQKSKETRGQITPLFEDE